MSEVDVHSRSRLAGYTPEILFNAVVLVVGAGALGQNLALNLALAGVGEIDIVDFDSFEAHNATRSPLYPTSEERARWGMEKAIVVAHKLLPMMTAPTPKVRYASTQVQTLGDLPLARANLVFSAVDNLAARAYLAERCKILQQPLIEAGFHAETLNLAVFGPEAEEPCYRCLSPQKVGAFSCTHYALQVEEDHAIPAIQNTAAVLAGLQAEVGVQWLHGERDLRDKAVYANIRTMSMHVVQLSQALRCPGVHWSSLRGPIDLEVRGEDTLSRLLEAVEREIGLAEVRLSEPLIMRNFCTRCNSMLDARVPEWRWLTSPRCTNCGGPFKPALQGRQIESITSVFTHEQGEVTRLTCAEVGLPGGSTVEVWPATPLPEFGERCLVRLRGSIDEFMQEVPYNRQAA